MKVLITGANGFVGKNLQLFLKEQPEVEVLTFNRDNNLTDLDERVRAADFIVHLAGINRPKEVSEFSGNFDLTKSIIDILKENNLKTPLIFSSSTQAELNNEYGRSKKAAEDYILENYPEGIVFRLHNVFGKYCRPNYNSVVATFCYKVAHDEEITINDPNAKISLIYIDDICKTFLKFIRGEKKSNGSINYIEPVVETTVGEVAELIKSFKKDLNSLDVPEVGNEFIKKLFSTYISYNELNNLVFSAEQHVDERGFFAELVHTGESGQFSVSTSKPGITRGNHYHHTKVEKFIVVKGQAKISMRKVGETEVYDFNVSGDEIKIITIPVGYTHNITNVGDDEMILIMWCNEIFDKENPDTFYEQV